MVVHGMNVFGYLLAIPYKAVPLVPATRDVKYTAYILIAVVVEILPTGHGHGHEGSSQRWRGIHPEAFCKRDGEWRPTYLPGVKGGVTQLLGIVANVQLLGSLLPRCPPTRVVRHLWLSV